MSSDLKKLLEEKIKQMNQIKEDVKKIREEQEKKAKEQEQKSKQFYL